MDRLLIVGAGGFGHAVAEAIAATSAYILVGFADDRWPELSCNRAGAVIGRISDLASLRNHADAVAIAVGNTSVRERIFTSARAAGFALPYIVHPRAYVAGGVSIGAGVLVMAGAVVGAESVLGDGALINAGAILDHDCIVEDFGHVGIAASMAGGAQLARGQTLAQAASLKAGEGRLEPL